MLTVVKVGGGLAREAGEDALRALCASIGAAGARHPLLVVPGGADFADTVRAHDRRLSAAAADRAPDGDPRDGPVRLGARRPDPGCGALRGRSSAGRDGVVSILLPAALLAEREPLPASWAVTSDSIAAWVAGAAGAARLVLVKPVAGLYRTWPPSGEPIARLTVDELAALRPAGVDEHLPAALRAARVETWVIDGREPARLAELLEEGHTAGTQVTAA